MSQAEKFTPECTPLLTSSDSLKCSYVAFSDQYHSGHELPALPLIPVVYRRRWYVLAVYALLAFTLGLTSNTFGSVALASERAFSWSDADIALLYNWRSVVFIVSVVGFACLVDNKGLRPAFVTCAFFLAFGSGLRCLSTTPPLSNWTMHAGQLVLSGATPVVYSAVSPVSMTWFPVHQRTTATAVPMFSWAIGSAAGYMIGPLLVPVRTDPDLPNTGALIRSAGSIQLSPIQDIENPTPDYILDMRSDILFYLILQFGLASAVFLVVVLYFPSKPPSPPSASASVSRVSLVQGGKALLGNKRFWILGVVYSATNGLYTSLAGVLEVDLKGLNVQDSQRVAGHLIFYTVISALVAGIVIARLADYYMKHLKVIIITLCILAALCFLWFTLIVDGYLPQSIPMLYMAFILGSVMINGAVPIFYELSCEATYPVSETLANGVLNLLNSVFCLFFYCLLMVPDIGTRWMNWVLTGAVALCVPIMIPFQQRNTRQQMDVCTGAISE